MHRATVHLFTAASHRAYVDRPRTAASPGRTTRPRLRRLALLAAISKLK